jgi:hypothetical protein
MRTITYTPRTIKTAVYWDINDEDMRFIKQQLELCLIEYSERSLSRDILDQTYCTTMTSLGSGLGYSPKYRCENTLLSTIGGILKNFKTGTKDLTDKNCDKIEQLISMIVSGQNQKLFPPFMLDNIRFQEYTKLSTQLNPELFS